MPRQLVTRNMYVLYRPPAIGREYIGFTNDGKIHVVLDTNVIIDALTGMNEKRMVDTKKIFITKLACMKIMDLWQKDFIVAGTNYYLQSEYERVISEKIDSKIIDSVDVGLINELMKKCVAVRVNVDQVRVSKHTNDDILFDGLVADYLISSNLKHLTQDKLLSKSTYKETISPVDFVNKFWHFSLNNFSF